MSQFDEDAHIALVLAEIGDGSKVLCDIGARLQGSNAAALIKRGWTGTLVDRNPSACEELRREFPLCKVLELTASPSIVNTIVPGNAHFLSIDVDSCDWWLWANLVHRPALVVIETNPLRYPYVAAMGETKGYGCSLEAAKMLGKMKGYDYIGRTVVNAFFVRKDLKCKYRLPEAKEHLGSDCNGEGNVLCATQD